MIFYRGRPPKVSFTLGSKNLELVNQFTYLGFIFTTQLSFSNHLNSISAKANSRCGSLNARLPIKNLPLDLTLRIYNCYILPLFRYGFPLYFSSCSISSKQSANSSFTKFLKSYLGIPFYANNSITHFLTNTSPLITTLEHLIPNSLNTLIFPSQLDNYKLSFLSFTPQQTNFNPIAEIPSYFWHSRTFQTLPSSFFYRKKLCREIFDLDHEIFCRNKKFHINIDPLNCICIACGKSVSRYHKYDCEIYHP